VHQLELEAVRVVQEDRVIALGVVVLLGAALDLRALPARPRRPLVDLLAAGDAEGEVVDARS